MTRIVSFRDVSGIFKQAIFYAFVLIFLFAVLAPFIWMLISSVSPQRELTQRPPNWIPNEPTIERYMTLFFPDSVDASVSVPIGAEKFVQGMTNSLIVSTVTTLICLAFGVMAAYALARIPLPGERYFMVGILGAQMMPIITIIIPLFLLMQTLALIDSLQGLIFLYTGFLLPTVIWILYSYFKTIPAELEEAAMIDGCSRMGTLIRVVLPVSGPGLVAVAAFTFLSSWNEFFMALIFTGSTAKTITVTVTEFSTQFGVDFGLMATGGIVGSIPPLILAFLLQRYIVQGLTAGATKG